MPPKMPQEAMIQAHYGEILYDLVLEKGGDSEAILANTGIRRDLLLSPDAYLSYQQFVQLVKNALMISKEPALGIEFGSRLKFTTHGALAQASLSCANLREAIEALVKYYKIRFALVEFEFFTDGSEAVIQIDENLGLGDLKRVLIEALFVAIMEVNEFLFGSKLVKTGRCLISYPAPSYVDAYRRYFHDMVEFDAGVNQLRFQREFLDEPMALANPVAKRRAEQQCEAELQAVLHNESIVQKVQKLLFTKGAPIPSMEDVAERLNMTTRTLRRQLQSFDTSFQDILADARKQRAIQLLKSTNRHIDEIAYELGYSDPSNFGRAFRKWTGKAPSDFRN